MSLSTLFLFKIVLKIIMRKIIVVQNNNVFSGFLRIFYIKIMSSIYGDRLISFFPVLGILKKILCIYF